MLDFLKKIKTIANETKTKVFKLDGIEGDYNYLNNKLFVFTNAAFLKGFCSSECINSSLAFNLISLMGNLDDPLPFDKGQEYISKWKEDPWNRNWHLWFRIHNHLFNNSLVRFNTFDYPDHLHAEKWGDLKLNSNYPYEWMNLMLECVLFFPPETVNSLEKLMQTLAWDSYEGLPKKEYSNKSDQWQKILSFSKPENREATYNHLVRCDYILDKPSFEKPIDITTDPISFTPFSVTTTKEQSQNLKAANCLNIFFQFREKTFLKQVQQRLPGEDYNNIEIFSKDLFGDDNGVVENFDEISKKRGAAYTSAEFLYRCLRSDKCPVIFVDGVHPTQKDVDVKNYQLPLGPDKLGLSEDLENIINEPGHRCVA